MQAIARGLPVRKHFHARLGSLRCDKIAAADETMEYVRTRKDIICPQCTSGRVELAGVYSEEILKFHASAESVPNNF